MGSRATELIVRQAKSTFNSHVLGEVGFFGGLYHLGGFRDPVLVSSADGVGTKVRIAAILDSYDTIGIDLVNHCVNDILVGGARPLFFLDYIGMGKLVPEKAGSLASGLARACKDVDCVLIGGETAEMPGVYKDNDFDLVGFIVGVVEKDQIIDGSSITSGDAVIAIPSDGLHTNGYSLVRKVFDLESSKGSLASFYPGLELNLGEELLKPHVCYLNVLKDHLGIIKGMAHITGGGLIENIPRVLPKNVVANIDTSSWSVPPIFNLIQETGNISKPEMFRVFNMGLGMVVIASKQHVGTLLKEIPGAIPVGEITEQMGDEKVNLY